MEKTGLASRRQCCASFVMVGSSKHAASFAFDSGTAGDMDKKSAEHLAKAPPLAGVRNGCIEESHCGKGAHSHAGDYSDVRVVTPDRNLQELDD
jgi:hypothetical protein